MIKHVMHVMIATGLLLGLLSGPVFAKTEIKNASNKPTNIRMLNWWEYLDKRVASDIKSNGFNLDVSIYQSNEVALARLLSKREYFDVAIVSNINLDLLLKEDIFDQKSLNKLSSERKYIKMISSQTACVPYMWGTTIFSYDSRVESNPPTSLKELLDMKKSGFNVGVLDDPFEISARIIGDNAQKCHIENFSNIFSQFGSCKKEILSEKLSFASADFVTSIDEMMLKPKAAFYGWQGSVFMNLKAAPWIKFNLSAQHPIIGADYVCILKNRGKKAPSLASVKKFVELLTNQKNTQMNVEAAQYFSPYQDDKNGLNPRVVDFYDQLIAVLAKTEPIFITTPDSKEHTDLNAWWKKVRYENK